MDYDKYVNKLEFPSTPKKPYMPVWLTSHPTKEDLANHALSVKEYETLLEAYEKTLRACRKARKAYNEEESRLYDMFKKDALEEVGLTGHKNADKVFSKAWEDGHAYGYSEVFNHLLDLADLVK